MYFRLLQNPSFNRSLAREIRFAFSNENKIVEELADNSKTAGTITNIFSIQLERLFLLTILIKDDVISFRNPTNCELKYFRIVEGVSDPEVKGLVLSIKESISDALLFGPQKQ
jgi:hypothetical protein